MIEFKERKDTHRVEDVEDGPNKHKAFIQKNTVSRTLS